MLELIKPLDGDEPYPAVGDIFIQNRLTTDDVTRNWHIKKKTGDLVW